MTFLEDLKAQQERWGRIMFNIWPIGHCIRFNQPMALIIDCTPAFRPRNCLSPERFLDSRDVSICMN
jgi:hypothetical protein